jgi:hypothetical protein
MDLADEKAAWRDALQEVERHIEARAPDGCRATLLLREMSRDVVEGCGDR